MRGRLGVVLCLLVVLGWLCAVPVVAAPPAGATTTSPAEATSSAVKVDASPAAAFTASETAVPTASTTDELGGSLSAIKDDPSTIVDDLSARGTDPSAGGARPFSASNGIRLTTTLDRTPSRVGEITARLSVSIPDRVTELTALLPAEADVQRTNGFEHASGSDYEWDGETDTPTVTFRITADRLSDREGPLAEDGQFLFADTESWSLVRIPRTSVTGQYTGSPEPPIVRKTEIDGPGAAGETMAFLGAHTVRTHTAHGQTFELVVPVAAEPTADADEVFSSLAHASDRLRVGTRDERVFMIVAPTDRVEWAVRGLQTGEADLWVQDTESLDDPSNVWVHEYVHTRQDYRAADDARWFTEGSATYYAALLTLEEGQIDFDRFQRFMREGEASPQSGAILEDPDEWPNVAQYTKGALVAGELDRQLRTSTDGEASLDTVFGRLNDHSGELRGRDVRGYVADAGGDAVGEAAERYTRTDAVPTMWDANAHATAFGQEPARFSFRLVNDALSVSGLDGETSVNERPVSLVAGETLTVEMVAENVGGTVGSYELTVRVDETERRQDGRLTPGETASHTFEYTFDEPGSYVVRVGGESIDVTVAERDAVDLPIDVETPGFGALGALGALGLLVALGRVGRH